MQLLFPLLKNGDTLIEACPNLDRHLDVTPSGFSADKQLLGNAPVQPNASTPSIVSVGVVKDLVETRDLSRLECAVCNQGWLYPFE